MSRWKNRVFCSIKHGSRLKIAAYIIHSLSFQELEHNEIHFPVKTYWTWAHLSSLASGPMWSQDHSEWPYLFTKGTEVLWLEDPSERVLCALAGHTLFPPHTLGLSVPRRSACNSFTSINFSASLYCPVCSWSQPLTSRSGSALPGFICLHILMGSSVVLLVSFSWHLYLHFGYSQRATAFMKQC